MPLSPKAKKRIYLKHVCHLWESNPYQCRASFPTALNLYAHIIKLSATPLLFVALGRLELPLSA